MVCVMLNRFMEISEKWLFDRLCGTVKADDRVVVIPFAFRDSQAAGNDDWQALYGRGGKYISGITESFAPYGILPEQFEIVNYFIDSREAAAEKINNADILYFTGGLPDKTMERLEEFELTDLIKQHDGTVIGFSAGAMIMLDKYHISPDKDYPEFVYKNGLGLVSGFGIEVHFDNLPQQIESIKRAIVETKLPIYTISDGGALIINNNDILCAGNACVYNL